MLCLWCDWPYLIPFGLPYLVVRNIFTFEEYVGFVEIIAETHRDTHGYTSALRAFNHTGELIR